jgi:hypothetical protein
LSNFRHGQPQPFAAFLPKLKQPESKPMDTPKKGYIPLEGKGRIKKNWKKEEGDKKPDLLGEMMHNGEIINFGIWRRESDYGEYWSLSVQDPNWKDAKKDAQYPKDVSPRAKMAGDVPF